MKWILSFILIVTANFVVDVDSARIRRQFGGFAFPDQFQQQFPFPNQQPQFPTNQFQSNFPFPQQNNGNGNNFQNNQNNQNNFVRPTQRPIQQQSTRAPQTTSTTVSPAVARCMEGCLTSTPSQYNPVCGTDEISYHNEERLNCARDCGKIVNFSRQGSCGQAGRS